MNTMNPTVPVSGGMGDKKLSDYVDTALRRKGLFFGIFVTALIVALGFALKLPPIYRATATILVEQQAVSEDLIKSTITSYAEQRILDISKRVMSNARLMEVIELKGLYSELRQKLPMGSVIDKMRRDINLNMAAADVVSGKGISKRRSQNIAFRVTFDYAHEPAAAQGVVQYLVDEILKENTSSRKKSAGGTYEFLAAEGKRLEEEAGRMNLALAEFKSRNNGKLPEQVAASGSVIERIERDLEEIDRQMFDLRQREVILRSDLTTVSKYTAPTLTNEVGEQVLSNSGRVQVLKSTYVTLLSKYSEKHPKMQKLRNEIATLGGNLDFAEGQGYATGDVPRAEAGFSKELNPAYVSLSTQLKVVDVERQSLASEKRSLRERLLELEGRLLSTAPIEAEYNRMQRNYDATLDKLDDLREKLNRAEMSEKLESSQQGETFSLMEPPIVPSAPNSPNRPQILALGLFLGLGAAFLAVMVREATDRSIYDEKVMLRVTGVKPMGVIPMMDACGEQESFVRERQKKIMWFGGAWVVLVILLGYVHLNVMPLAEVWQMLVDRVGRINL